MSLFVGATARAFDDGCPDGDVVTVGAPFRLDVGAAAVDLPPGTVTIIDRTKPSANLFPAPVGMIRYKFPDSRAVSILFASLHVLGSTYRINDYFGSFQIAATPGIPFGTPEVRTFTFHHPLVFDRGDVFAVVIRPAEGTSSGLVMYESSPPSGVLIGSVDIGQQGSVGISQLRPVRGVAMAAFARGNACGEVPAPELLLPVVGDITGRAHYSTDVSLYAPVDSTLTWTIRDRLRDAGAPTLINGSAASNGSLAGLPPSYLGSMTLSVPALRGRGTRASDDVSATARITARTALGETGSAITAVSCERIGHTIAVPFHVAPGYRVNIGIASAQLNSCGIFKAATAIIARVNDGAPVTLAMPAESIQLDDVTGDNTTLQDARGLTDGVVYLSVTDEAARIVAYSSLLDNTSQSSTLTIGSVIR